MVSVIARSREIWRILSRMGAELQSRPPEALANDQVV
jgi:hypothetical protein